LNESAKEFQGLKKLVHDLMAGNKKLADELAKKIVSRQKEKKEKASVEKFE
jgi:hypothetical protein